MEPGNSMREELFKDRGKLYWEKKWGLMLAGVEEEDSLQMYPDWQCGRRCSRVLGHSGEQDQEQSWKWPNKGGSDGKADAQVSALWNSGTDTNSATFKPCWLTLQRLHFLIYEMVMILSAHLSLCVKWKWHNKYLLSIYYVSGAMIGIKDPGLNKEDKNLCPHRA